MFLKGFDKNGNPQDVQVTEDGEIVVKIVNEESSQEVETTLNASLQTVGTTATTIAINKKVIQIDIANYSEEANVTLTAGGISAVIGPNVATTIKLNKQVDNISLVSTVADTKVQLVVNGVE